MNRVTNAAIRVQGLIISMPRPARHPEIIKRLNTNLNDKITVKPSEQGFVDLEGNFLSRHDASELALEAGQIPYRNRSNELFTEDLF